MADVLKHIRVLDFGRFIAGPYCGAILADFGADVIRVEKVGGNPDRYLGAHLAETGEGPVFMQLNRNKRSVALDPTTVEGKEIIKRLIATADVVICNLPWRDLPKLGLDYDTLKGIKPDIILATMSAFGHVGPYANRIGLDGIAQALSSAMWHTGTGDGTPVKAAAQYTDYGTGLASAIGVLIALMHRDQTGEGQVVEGNLLKTGMVFASSYLIDQAAVGEERPRNSNRSNTSAPTGVFHCKDGYIVTQAATDPLFRRWAKLMGEEDYWLNDPRYQDDIGRGMNNGEISERMQQWCSEKTTEECVRTLNAARMPCARVLSSQETLEDAHVQETGMFREIDFPGQHSPIPVVDTQVWLSKTPGDIRSRPPLAGEHNHEVLSEIGYSSKDITSFFERGVIGSPIVDKARANGV